MAEMKPGFTMVGSISNLSAYKRRGSDKIFLRTKGGPSKEQIDRNPSFAGLRKRNVEFGGRSTACSWIRKALYPQLALADYNIAGPLNALLKPVQVLDMDHEPGRRNIYLSKQPQLLSGFSLNRTYTFDSVVRNPLAFTLFRDTLSGFVEIPALLPGINFHTSDKHPLYSFIAALGVIPDVIFDGVKYDAPIEYQSTGAIVVESAWHPVLNGSPSFRLDVSIPQVPPDAAFSLMLSIGVRFGTIAEGGVTQQVKHAGSAKVLAMV